MYTVDTLVQTALAETGYLEKRSLSGLDDQTANAGAGNYTKYARDLHKAGYYNGSKQGVAWCNVFVDWCHYMAAEKQKTIAQKVSCQSGPYGAGCKYSMGYYQTAGQFVTKDPQPGDQIYFGTAHSVDHTGIVWKVENGRVHSGDVVIETVVREYLQELKDWGADTLILGCTHYPLLMEVIGAFMGEGVALINSGAAAAEELKAHLEQADLTVSGRDGDAWFYASDRVQNFEELAELFLAEKLPHGAKKIDIEQY